jgi:hypothetical protein
MRALDELPYQFHVDIINNPRSNPQHYEYASFYGYNYFRDFVETLISLIPENACIFFAAL